MIILIWQNINAHNQTASGIAKLRAGYTFGEASALKQVQNAKAPILFMRGSLDNFVHTEMVYTLYDTCPTRKALYVAERRETETPVPADEAALELQKLYDGTLLYFAEKAKEVWPRLDIQPAERSVLFENIAGAFS